MLLGLVCGGGYYNYQRNAHLDKDLKFRPFAGITDPELQVLVEAYETKMQHMARNFGASGPQVHNRRAAPSDLPSKVAAFEQFQRENERWKEGRRQILSESATIDQLRHEQKIREQGLHKPWVRMMRRVTTM